MIIENWNLFIYGQSPPVPIGFFVILGIISIFLCLMYFFSGSNIEICIGSGVILIIAGLLGIISTLLSDISKVIPGLYSSLITIGTAVSISVYSRYNSFNSSLNTGLFIIFILIGPIMIISGFICIFLGLLEISLVWIILMATGFSFLLAALNLHIPLDPPQPP